MTAAELARETADEKAARDGKSFYARYLESAVHVELRLYFHPGGIVSTEPTAPTREEIILSTMATKHGTAGPGQAFVTAWHNPTREEAEAMVDGAAARYAAGDFGPPAPKPVTWRDRGGHVHVSTPHTVVNADGTREEWPPLELRETNG